TDGDLRRAILKFDSIRSCQIADIMTRNPVSIPKGTLAIKALRLMQNRSSQISVIPVVNQHNQPIGLIRMHDLIGAGL
ncbi:MAG: CBS domain-containing protein, partial [Leptospiraceae bacterium]|nr:CBS domain-containing protein [Leptospiraceae bacterium]